MARYIDADKFAERIKASPAFRNIYDGLLLQRVVIDLLNNAPTADVVPKSEVESILNEIENTIRGALVLLRFSYKANQKEFEIKEECYMDFLGYIAELKKKYTEVK